MQLYVLIYITHFRKIQVSSWPDYKRPPANGTVLQKQKQRTEKTRGSLFQNEGLVTAELPCCIEATREENKQINLCYRATRSAVKQGWRCGEEYLIGNCMRANIKQLSTTAVDHSIQNTATYRPQITLSCVLRLQASATHLVAVYRHLLININYFEQCSFSYKQKA